MRTFDYRLSRFDHDGDDSRCQMGHRRVVCGDMFMELASVSNVCQLTLLAARFMDEPLKWRAAKYLFANLSALKHTSDYKELCTEEFTYMTEELTKMAAGSNGGYWLLLCVLP